MNTKQFEVRQEVRLAMRQRRRGALGRYRPGTRLTIVGEGAGAYDWKVETGKGFQFWVSERDVLSEADYEELAGVLKRFQTRLGRGLFGWWVMRKRPDKAKGVAGQVKQLRIPQRLRMDGPVLREILEASVAEMGLPAAIRVGEMVGDPIRPYTFILARLASQAVIVESQAGTAEIILFATTNEGVFGAAAVPDLQETLFSLTSAARQLLRREVPWVELVAEPECMEIGEEGR